MRLSRTNGFDLSPAKRRAVQSGGMLSTTQARNYRSYRRYAEMVIRRSDGSTKSKLELISLPANRNAYPKFSVGCDVRVRIYNFCIYRTV